MTVPTDVLIIHPHHQVRDALATRLGQEASIRVRTSVANVSALHSIASFLNHTTIYGLTRADDLRDENVRSGFMLLCAHTRVIILYSYLDNAITNELQCYQIHRLLPLTLDLQPLLTAIADP